MIFFSWKTVYSEAAIQNFYKNCHLGNFGEIIVHYLNLGVYTLVKAPSNSFQFKSAAYLSSFTVDKKHSKFPSGKKTDLTCWIRYFLLNHNQLSSLSSHKYLVWCFYSDVRFTKKFSNTYCHYQTWISEIFTRKCALLPCYRTTLERKLDLHEIIQGYN